MSGIDVIDRLRRARQVHRHQGKLRRGAALHEQYFVVCRNRHQLAQIRLGRGRELHESGAAVADLHDGHAAVPPIQQLIARLLQDLGRQNRGSRREIETRIEIFKCR